MAGCEWDGFISPIEVPIQQKKEPLVVPILHTLDPSVDENDRSFVNATAPTPADRETGHEEYRISPNDMLSIGISDLVAPGQEQIQTRRVSEAGMISLPYIGALQASGLTEIELEQAITQTYKDLALIQNANVSVTVVEARGRSFEVLGSVARPNIYAIPEAEFRLLDALVVGGDVTSPLIDYVYIIRRTEQPRPVSRPIRRTAPGGGPATLPTPIPSPGDLSPRGAAQQPPGPATAINSNEAQRALNLMADTEPTAPAIANRPSLPPVQNARPSEAAEPVVLAQMSGDRNFRFNSPSLPANVRIIRIPYQALHNGDLSYNVAIRPHDIVWVKPLQVGVYYVYGHVARPGVFTLSGQKVTIKQAIGGAGMFDEVAIPQRAEIIRKIEPDHEMALRIDLHKIFAMEQPDVYLKPDDQIIVGTNAVAPFLAALRGAFRITYGFGFLYDRNYAYNNFAGGL